MKIKTQRIFKSNLIKGLLMLMFGLLVKLSLGQTTFSWRNDQNPTSGQWNISSYWWNGSGAALPGGAEILYLDGNVGTTMTNDLPSTNRFRINFGANSATSRTINGSTSNLFFDYSNAIPAIYNNSGVTQTINFPIQIANSSQITSPNYGFELNAQSGNLTIGSTISAANNTGTKVLVLRASNSGTGTITLNGIISNGSGTMSISKIESNTAVLNAANTYTGTTTISAGTLKLNKTGGTTIPITNNVVVSAGTLQISSDQTLNNLTISSGGLTIDDGVTLTINGTLTYSGGTMSYGSTTLGNLVISSSGQLIVSSGTFSTNGRLTLKSDASGTASIGNSAGSISGNVTVERYIPALSSSGIRGRYRFLSSPLTNATLADWQGETHITGLGIGFDTTTTNAPSVYWYEETRGGNLNTRWTAATATTGYDLVNGRGYRVFIRGDRTANRLNGVQSPDQNAITLNLTGTLKQGSVNFNSPTDLVTYTGSGSDAGWCLIGNPYASPIDWQASSGWTRSNVGSGIAIFNPQTNSYSYSINIGDASDNSFVSVNGGSRYISSGQGFFIRTTNSSPTLSCSESVKVTNTPAYIYKTPPSNQLRLKLIQDSTNIDETVIAFGEKFSDDFLETEDVNKLTNVTVNISSVVGIEQYAAINFTSINYKEKTIPLSVWGNANGNYQLDLTQVEGFDPTVTLFLKDKFLNTTTTIDQNKSINFSITDDSLSKGDFRFEILFKNNNTNVNEISSSIFKTNLNLFPNPASDILNINLSNANFKNSNIVVYNLSGMEVIKSIMNGASAQLNIETLGSGVYFVKVSNENGFSKTVKFVK